VRSRESGDPLLFILSALGGLGIESFLVSRGVYRFDADPTVVGVPVWLPLFWGYSVLAARRAIRGIERRVNPLIPVPE
jgi:hypothetical protein